MRNNKKYIIICAGVALLILIIAGIAAWYGSDSVSYNRHIALAEKYYAEGQFDDAVLSYQEAIRILPKEEEGYKGLARTYKSMGQNVLARSALQTGMDNTGNYSFKLMINGFDGEVLDDTGNNVFAKPGSEGINFSLLSILASTVFNEYRLRNGIVSTDIQENGECAVVVKGIDGVLFYPSSEIDSSGEKPVSDSVPSYIVLNSAIVLFNNNQGMNAEKLSDYGAENVEFSNDDHGRVVTFDASGCRVSMALDDENRITDGAWNRIEPLIEAEEDDDSEGSCSVAGRIVSATTGEGVSGVCISLRSGNNMRGQSSKNAYTDSFGNYLIKLDPGEYEAEASCEGYQTESFSVYVGTGRSMNAETFILSPLMGSGQIRIVLEWGANPTDLDSYLDGSTDRGNSVHVNYTNKTSSGGGDVIAELDVDDTDGYGPETTTIHNINGDYDFYVRDFTESGTMSMSGAKVKIYTSDGAAPIEVNICAGLGNYWHVCQIRHGKVTVTNHG